MSNKNAYLKYKFLKTNRTLEDLSSDTKIDKGHLSRIFNNKYSIKKERNLIKICNSLNINPDKLNYENNTFELLIKKFLKSVIFIGDKRDKQFKIIKDFENDLQDTPYLLDIMLTEYIYLTIKKNFNENHSNLEKTILSIINSCDKEYQIYFFTYQLTQYDYTKNYTKAAKYITLCSNLNYKDENLKSIFYYHCFQYYVNQSQLSEAIKYYQLCKEILEKNKNTNRLANLNIIYANYLVAIGLISEAINNYLIILEYLNQEKKKLYNISIIYNNIAFCYFILSNYKGAKQFYLKTLEYMADNEIYLCLALSCFKLNEIEDAKVYINLGKQAENAVSYYYKLLDWLEAFIKKPYSKKTATILLNILDKDIDYISTPSKNIIYSELSNYYKYHNDYEKAYYYLSQVTHGHQTFVS